MRTILKVLSFLCLIIPGNSFADLDVSVMEASIAKEIKSRTPLGVGSLFPASVGKLFCYTKIKSNADNTINHRWYYEGKLMAEVALSVKQGEWRTKSSKNITKQWAGKWRVDITTFEGKLLDSIFFRVAQDEDEKPSDTTVSPPSPPSDFEAVRAEDQKPSSIKFSDELPPSDSKVVQSEGERLADKNYSPLNPPSDIEALQDKVQDQKPSAINCSAPSPPADIEPTFIVSSFVGDDDKADGVCVAYKTISRAIKAAKQDDLIWVAAGIYDAELGENFPIKIPRGVSLIGDPTNNGAGNDSPIISGQGEFIQKHYAAIVGSTESVVKGFTIKTGTEFFRFGIISSDADMTIINNTFSDSYGGVYLLGGGNPLIESNTFSAKSYGIYIDHAGVAKIRKNDFIEGSFIRILKGSPVIYENSFSGPHYSAILVQFGSPLIEKNAFNSSYSGGAIQLVYRAYPVVRYNTFKSGVAVDIKGASLPDLGTKKDPGGNVFTGDRCIGLMLKNNNTVYAVGNTWVSGQAWVPRQPLCGCDIKVEEKGSVVWGDNEGGRCI